MSCPRCGYIKSEKGRSNNQNRYYWGCVVQILSDETGYTKDEIHEIIKRKFLTEYRVYSKNGKLADLELTKSTKILDTREWEDLMTKIRVWASATLGIFINEPNEQLGGYDDPK